MVSWLPDTEPDAAPENTVPFCGRPAPPAMSMDQPAGEKSSAAAAGNAFSAKDFRRERGKRVAEDGVGRWESACMEHLLNAKRPLNGMDHRIETLKIQNAPAATPSGGGLCPAPW
jgi:hypothetical protein